MWATGSIVNAAAMESRRPTAIVRLRSHMAIDAHDF
jgi:hypothetical protein